MYKYVTFLFSLSFTTLGAKVGDSLAHLRCELFDVFRIVSLGIDAHYVLRSGRAHEGATGHGLRKKEGKG